jgi:hypothetical protein
MSYVIIRFLTNAPGAASRRDRTVERLPPKAHFLIDALVDDLISQRPRKVR